MRSALIFGENLGNNSIEFWNCCELLGSTERKIRGGEVCVIRAYISLRIHAEVGKKRLCSRRVCKSLE